MYELPKMYMLQLESPYILKQKLPIKKNPEHHAILQHKNTLQLFF